MGRCRPQGCTAVNWTKTTVLLFAPCLRGGGADGRGGLLEASGAGKVTSASAICCSACAHSGSAKEGGCNLAPHSAQNFAAGVLSVPHCPHATIIQQLELGPRTQGGKTTNVSAQLVLLGSFLAVQGLHTV